MNKLLALVLIAACVAASPSNVQPSKELNCFQQDNELVSCFFVKVISTVDKAARSSDIELADGVTFVRDLPMERNGKSLEKSELEIMNELPRDISDRTWKLFEMLYDSTVSFLKSHSLKLNMPEESMSRAFVEGRAKVKKMFLPLIAVAGLKIFTLVPILLGGLGLLALKALFVGKIALLIAGIVAFQKLFGGSNLAGSFINRNPVPYYYDAGASGSWPTGSAYQGYRSLEITDKAEVDPHNLAYFAQAPITDDNN